MRVLHLLFLMCSFFTLAAQNEPQVSTTTDHKYSKRTVFGFKGGFNRSHVRGVEMDGDKTGYIGGELYGAFFCEKDLNTRLILEGELLFSWTNDYHFIEMPLHLKYLFSKKWAAFAGPKIDYLVDAENSPPGPFYDLHKFGISGELGVQYNFSRRLFAETRYARGLTSHVRDYFLDINKGKRDVFRVGLGIRF